MLVEVAPKRLEQMGTILIGGGPIAPATEAILAERRMQAYHSFAMTETLSHFALRKLGCDIEYKALPGVQLSTDIQGRLRVKCPWATEPELQTNDIVAMTSTNRFRWLGRADFVINSGAVKVLPEQVEEFLSAWIDVPFAIVGLPDAEWGQRAVLVLERVFEVNLDQIEFPHPAWKPTRIRVVPHLPRTSNGKLARADLIGQLLSSDTGAIH
jgi:O-succinylbenzoic acid--CoA ligase